MATAAVAEREDDVLDCLAADFGAVKAQAPPTKKDVTARVQRTTASAESSLLLSLFAMALVRVVERSFRFTLCAGGTSKESAVGRLLSLFAIVVRVQVHFCWGWRNTN